MDYTDRYCIHTELKRGVVLRSKHNLQFSEISKHECLGVFEHKTNIGMHIFQHYDIITKSRSLLAYDVHSALLSF